MVLELTDKNFKKEVLESEKTVIVDIYATWCGPCKMMSPVIDSIAEELGEKVKVGKVDSDKNPGIAQRYDVMSIPTILIIKNGEVKNTFIGLTSKSEIVDAALADTL